MVKLIGGGSAFATEGLEDGRKQPDRSEMEANFRRFLENEADGGLAVCSLFANLSSLISESNSVPIERWKRWERGGDDR
jgi:hypothetical protein